MRRCAAAAAVLAAASGRVVDLEADAGAVAGVSDLATCWKNGGLLNTSLRSLRPGDTLVIPNKTFHVMGGIVADNLASVTIRLDGTLSYSDDIDAWPRKGPGNKAQVLECLSGRNWTNVTFTSAGVGTMDGNGAKWWGIPGIGYLIRGEDRPRLFHVEEGKDMLFENIRLVESPYWNFLWSGDGLEVRNSVIDSRRTKLDRHDIIDITAFNTDGFDVAGKNVWIHDSEVWNQDDSFCVKGTSSNMVFENVRASGVGLTIGSIGGETVRNITFRDIYMHHTYKGIYMKFNGGNHGHIEDITYENIVMDEPEQYAIWIGPAQQSDSTGGGNPIDALCHPNPCSLCWPTLPGAQCNSPDDSHFANITLRNVTVNGGKGGGVVLANASSPMRGVVFDGVRFNNPKKSHWDGYYYCENAGDAVARGDTWPVPPCFKDETVRAA